MIILALDQKLSGSGWCLAEDDRFISSGYHKNKEKDPWQKIDGLTIWLQAWLNFNHVDCLVIEFPSGNSQNMDTNIKLGAVLYGCIFTYRYWWATRNNKDPIEAPLIIVRPTEIKATGVYKGQLEEANKYSRGWRVFEEICKSDGTVNKAAMNRQDDEIDAIGCWLAGLKRIGEQK